jgi:hypothetical protein
LRLLMHFQIHNSTSLVLFHARVSLSPRVRVLIGRVGLRAGDSSVVDMEIIVRRWKRVENCKEPAASQGGWKHNCLFRSNENYSNAALPIRLGRVGREEYTSIYWICPKFPEKLWKHSAVMKQEFTIYPPKHCNRHLFCYGEPTGKKVENKQLVDLPHLER